MDGTSVPSVSLGPVTVYFGAKSGKYPDGNQVVVTGREAKAAFDTPLVSHRLRRELAGAERVILTHAHEDHVAGLGLLPEAEVWAPEQDVDAVRSVAGMLRHFGYAPATLERMRRVLAEDFHFVPRPDARGYAPEAEWDLGGVRVRAVHMPGHTRGHSVLMVEPEPIAFIGDIDLTGFGPYYGDACSDLGQFRGTLARMEHLEARAWITSHHKGVITERETYLALLRRFAGRIEAREQAIEEALAGRGRTLEALVAQRFLFPPGYDGVFVADAERRTITQHLAELVARGRVVEEAGGVYRRRAA